MFGGGMVGLQFAALKAQLGPLLNNIVNYDCLCAGADDEVPRRRAFLVKYQASAPASRGSIRSAIYLPPFAYAQMQMLEAGDRRRPRSLDDAKLAD